MSLLRPREGVVIGIVLSAVAFFALEKEAWALEPFKATLYKIGSERKTPLFRLANTEKRDGAQVVSTLVSYDLAGKPSVTEELAEIAGASAGQPARLKHYRLTHHELGEQGSVELSPDGKKAVFVWKSEGRTKTSTETVGEDFVVPMSLFPFIKSKWVRIRAGERVQLRLACLDRLETVGFTVFKSGEVERGGKPHVQVTMEASSWLIRKLVKPIVFTISSDGTRMPDFTGRVMAKLDGKDLDAEFVYE